MKKLQVCMALLSSVLLLARCAIVINGCQQTTILPSGQVRCQQCNFNMGITKDGKCAFCKFGQSVVRGVCIVARPQITTPTIVALPTMIDTPQNVDNTATNNVSNSNFSQSSNSNRSTVSFTVSNPVNQQVQQTSTSSQNSVGPSSTEQTIKQSQNQTQSVVGNNINSSQKDQQIVSQQQTTAPSIPASLPVSVSTPQQSQKINSNAFYLISNDFSSFGSFSAGSFNSDFTNSLPPSTPIPIVTQSSNANSLNTINDIPSLPPISTASVIKTDVQTPIFSQQSTDNKSKQTVAPQKFIPSIQGPIQIPIQAPIQAPIQIPVSSPVVKPTLTVNTSKASPTPVVVVHKFSQFPFCFDYSDDACWACVQGYLLNLVINACIPYVKPPTVILTADSNSNETTLKTQTAQANCNIFSQQTKTCQECFRNFYLNKSSSRCEPVDVLCRTYDPDTGACLSCYSKYSIKGTKCVVDQPNNK